MAKAKKGKAAAAAPTEMLLVASKVRQMIKDAGCNTAGDALDGLNAYVGWLVGPGREARQRERPQDGPRARLHHHVTEVRARQERSGRRLVPGHGRGERPRLVSVTRRIFRSPTLAYTRAR